MPVEGGVRSNQLGLRCPLWTENKAKLIQEYIRLFTFVTKHGAYIDGFAAPQRRDHEAMCSARLVLENKPQWIRKFWLCDIDPEGIVQLERFKEHYYRRGTTIQVLEGDFNRTVDRIIASGRITEKVATFALLDQRTFQCKWETVRKLAAAKSGTKVELFYFFPTGWVDRSIAAVSRPETRATVEAWWGRGDWAELRGLNSAERATVFAQRFIDELGYVYAHPYAIHSRARGGRTMYHMVHATDHPEATKLMLRAYRKVSGRRDWDREPSQLQMDMLLQHVTR